MSTVINELRKCFYCDCYTCIAALLKDTSLNYAIIKGEVLSKQIYKRVGQRCSSDIDILIPRTKIYEFEQILCKGGFHSSSKNRQEHITLLSASHQVAPWIKELPPWGTVVADLNFDVFWGEYEGFRIDIEEFLSDTVNMEIYGVTVKTLSPMSFE